MAKITEHEAAAAALGVTKSPLLAAASSNVPDLAAARTRLERRRIAHGHSRVKRSRIVKDRIRRWKQGVRDLVMERTQLIPRSRAVYAKSCSDSTASFTARSLNSAGYFFVVG